MAAAGPSSPTAEEYVTSCVCILTGAEHMLSVSLEVVISHQATIE